MTSAKVAREQRAVALAQVHEDQRRHGRRRRLVVAAASALVVVLLVAVVTAALLSARETTAEDLGPAPDFTLRATDGSSVSLADFRGSPVVLYFSEGAGCGSCLQQMGEIEKDPAFAEAGITVLPIVMNTAEQISADMATYGVTTPFLLDDGTVSEEYGTLGTGMQDYTASTSLSGGITVAYTNDGGNRDVQVDYIIVNGQVRQSEAQSYNTGLYANGSCGGGGYSEWMHCNGAIGYGNTP